MSVTRKKFHAVVTNPDESILGDWELKARDYPHAFKKVAMRIEPGQERDINEVLHDHHVKLFIEELPNVNRQPA